MTRVGWARRRPPALCAFDLNEKRLDMLRRLADAAGSDYDVMIDPKPPFLAGLVERGPETPGDLRLCFVRHRNEAEWAAFCARWGWLWSSVGEAVLLKSVFDHVGIAMDTIIAKQQAVETAAPKPAAKRRRK